MKPSFRILFSCLFFSITAATAPANAAWPPNGLFINALPAPGYFGPLDQAPDGAGGIFLSFGVNVQRISPSGDLLLGPNGVNAALTSPTGCVADGAGGVFLAGLVGNTLKLVRMNSLGAVLWTSNVCATGNQKVNLMLSSDDQGGALVAWSEARALPSPDNGRILYVQRMNASGNALWTADGVRVLSTQMGVMGDQIVGTNVYGIELCPSGDGGAFVSGGGQESINAITDPLHALFVPAAGSGPVGVAGTTNRQLTMIPDGAGGIYVCKFDAYEVTGYGLELSRVVPNVGTSWTTELTTANPYYATMARSSDGVLVAWQLVAPQGDDIYAQKASTDGVPQWTTNGVPVCTVYGLQSEPAIATDFAGGAHIVFSDRRYPQKDLYRQHIDVSGDLTLDDYEGLLVTNDNEDTRPTLYTDPSGYAIVAWHTEVGNYALRFDTGPVSVAITYFTATLRDGRVVLEAEMSSNLNIQSVQIYRAIDAGSLQLLHSADAPDAERFQYEDTRVLPGTRYRYQLVVTDNDGEFSSPIAELTTPALATELKQNHPNPFNPETTIGFSLEAAGRTTVNIYAVDGRHVRTLLDENRGVGFHRVTWDGTDDEGRPVGSGVYLYKLSADKYSATRKMLLLK